jgi:sulfite reductase (NADPH) flavoprotein alpha-component
MRQVGREVWDWLADGAHVYICGAVRMGQDVERALVDVVTEHGRRSPGGAIAFVSDLKKRGRFQTDVY